MPWSLTSAVAQAGGHSVDRIRDKQWLSLAPRLCLARVPFRISVLKAHPRCEGVRRWVGLWLGPQGGAPINEIGALVRSPGKLLPLPS